jgi:hypothetical protein
MSQNMPEGSQKNRKRLDNKSVVPTSTELSSIKSEVQANPGLSIELPWTINSQIFVLTAHCDLAGKDPLWTVYKGEGPESEVIWTNVEQDVELISDVLFMAAGAASPAKPATRPVEELKAHIPYDMSLLEKQPNILLGHLLVEAGLISEPNLEQALKLQEQVRAGKLTETQMSETVQKAFSDRPVKEQPKAAAQPKSATSTPAQNSRQIQKVVDLLKQAGIVTEQDIQLSVLSWLQSQGNLGNILVSSGKIDNNTLEAAATCLPLIEQNLMKAEQAIIALHYCTRSRVTFDEALSEMGWENPRKT